MSLPSIKNIDFFRIESKRSNGKEEEPTDNNKRQRTFPSERNQFVIHVYVPLPYDEYEPLQDIRDTLEDTSDIITFESEPHLSLIRGHYAVQYHQIEPLLAQLTLGIESTKQFSVCLSQVRLFSNEDESRHFIAICDADKTDSAKSPQQDFLKSLRSILKQYRSEITTVPTKLDDSQLDTFIYHTSIAWFLAADKVKGEHFCQQVRDLFDDEAILVRVKQVHIKIGHRSKIVNLL